MEYTPRSNSISQDVDIVFPMYKVHFKSGKPLSLCWEWMIYLGNKEKKGRLGLQKESDMWVAFPILKLFRSFWKLI